MRRRLTPDGGLVDPIDRLRSGSDTERLAGARELLEDRPENLESVRRARDRETNHFVQQALDQVLKRWTDDALPAEEDREAGLDSFSAQEQEVLRLAYREIAGEFLHEVEPIVGNLRARASIEVPDFDSSMTARAIGRLLRFVEALRNLHLGTGPPRQVDLDITDVVGTVLSEEDARGVVIRPARDDPVAAFGDPDVLSLILRNVVNNAVESVLERREAESSEAAGGEDSDTPDDRPPVVEVVINWAASDRDYWISVIDRGLGLPVVANRAFDAWETSKRKDEHLGIGLTIARLGIDSLMGSIDLMPQEGGGVVCEIRWPRQDEER